MKSIPYLLSRSETMSGLEKYLENLDKSEREDTLRKITQGLPPEYLSKLDIEKDRKERLRREREQQKFKEKKSQKKIEIIPESEKIISKEPEKKIVRPLEEHIKISEIKTQVPNHIRHEIDNFAINHRLSVLGTIEKIKSYLSYIFPNVSDTVSETFIEKIARMHNFKEISYESYSLSDTLDSLKYYSEFLLGKNRDITGINKEKVISMKEYIKRDLEIKNPFAIEFLETFTTYHSGAEISRLISEKDSFRKIEVYDSNLKEFIKEFYTIQTKTKKIDIGMMNKLLSDIQKINMDNDKDGIFNISLRHAVEIFQNSYIKLHKNWYYELFPVLCKQLGFSPNEAYTESFNLKLYDFLKINSDNVLSLESFNEKRLKNEERKKEIIQNSSLEEEKETFEEKYLRTLKVLEKLYNGSEFSKLLEYPDLLNYFDRKIFRDKYKFYNVQHMSPRDPLGQIMVLHRLLNNVLVSIDTVNLDSIILDEEGVGTRINELSREWAKVYTLFDRYTNELNEYYKEISESPEREREFSKSKFGERIRENINQIRNHVMRNYGHTVITIDRKNEYQCEPVYLLSEALTNTLEIIFKNLNEKNIGRIIDERSEEDFITRIKKAIKRNDDSINFQKNALTLIFKVSQMYSELLNNKSSDYREVCGEIVYLTEDEKKNRESRKNPQLSVRVNLPEEFLENNVDVLTGLKSKNYYETYFEKIYEKLISKNIPLSLLVMDLDNFKKVNDSLGHSFGDIVLKKTGENILSSIRNMDEAIRYGGEEFLVLIPNDYKAGMILGERIRRKQEEILSEYSSEFTKIPEIFSKNISIEYFLKNPLLLSDEKLIEQFKRISSDVDNYDKIFNLIYNNPAYIQKFNEFVDEYSLLKYGTLSIGIAQIENIPNFKDAFNYVDKILYRAKQTGKNQVVCEIGHEKKLISYTKYLMK